MNLATSKDYFFNWAVELVPEDPSFTTSLATKLKNEIWLLLRKFITRIQTIDAVRFLTETLPPILQKHFEKFNLASSQQIDENQYLIRFMIASHLENDRAEMEFLRKICEYLLKILLPNNYAACDELVFLIRELFCNHVCFKLIDYICDPYFINHQAIVYAAIVGPAVSGDIQPVFDDKEGLVDLPCTSRITEYHPSISKTEVKHIEKHINKTRAKIDEFRQKLNQKVLDLQASGDISLNSINLNKDIEQLRVEIHDLECHLTRAELWRFNAGVWLIEVHSVEKWTETDEMIVLFLVYSDKSKASSSRASSTGWVTIRSLAEVCEQKRRLSKKIPALRKLDHPIFRRDDKGQKTIPQSVWKKELQQFFDLVIHSEELMDSEEVFIFLSPTPGNIISKISNVPTVTSKLSKLPFLPYFGVSPILLNSSQKAASSKNRSLYSQSAHPGFNLANQTDSSFIVAGEEETKEDISDSIYTLVREIFELKKAQNFIRRTIILFFQLAFGKTINKQIKDTVTQITDEAFIVKQLTNLRDTFWPNGELAEPAPEVSEDDMKLTYLLAKQYLINNLPDVFMSLIGQQNAKKGFLKMFEAVQNKKANKQLFYEVFEAFLMELAPEISENLDV